jgi:hypothetical protein
MPEQFFRLGHVLAKKANLSQIRQDEPVLTMTFDKRAKHVIGFIQPPLLNQNHRPEVAAAHAIGINLEEPLRGTHDLRSKSVIDSRDNDLEKPIRIIPDLLNIRRKNFGPPLRA